MSLSNGPACVPGLDAPPCQCQGWCNNFLHSALELSTGLCSDCGNNGCWSCGSGCDGSNCGLGDPDGDLSTATEELAAAEEPKKKKQRKAANQRFMP